MINIGSVLNSQTEFCLCWVSCGGHTHTSTSPYRLPNVEIIVSLSVWMTEKYKNLLEKILPDESWRFGQLFKFITEISVASSTRWLQLFKVKDAAGRCQVPRGICHGLTDATSYILAYIFTYVLLTYYLLTHLFTYLLITYLITYLLNYLLTHSLTHSLT